MQETSKVHQLWDCPRGSHHIKSWSVTKRRVTLYSAEAELAALVKASAETIGVLQMAQGLGDETTA